MLMLMQKRTLGESSTKLWQRSFHREGTNFSRAPLRSLRLFCAAVLNTHPDVSVASQEGLIPAYTESSVGWAGVSPKL